MNFGFLLLLCTSGALGAGLRRPRQGTSSGSGSTGGSPFEQIGQFQSVTQNFQNPDPQGFIQNPQGQIPNTNQIQGFIPGSSQGGTSTGGSQQQQQQQQQGSTFFNRNPPQQTYFVNRNPPNPNEPIPIISYENVQPGDGTYRYSYETGDGIKKEETGEQRVSGEPPEAGTAARGSYSYTDLDGNQIALSYTADENGFRPSGSHLPTPPPIPKDIMAALEESAQAEAAQNNGVISPAYHYFFTNFRRI